MISYSHTCLHQALWAAAAVCVPAVVTAQSASPGRTSMRVYSNPRYSDRAFLAKLGISTKRVGPFLTYSTVDDGEDPGPLRDMADLLDRYDAVRGGQMATRARVLRLLHEAMSDELDTPLDEIDGNFCERLQCKLDAWQQKRPAEAEQAFYTVRAVLAWSYCADFVRDDWSHVLWGGRVLWGPARRDRILDFSELAEIWHAAGDLSFPFGPAFRFLVATAAKAEEVMASATTDVGLDTDNRCFWTLDRLNRFTGRPHRVELNFLAGESFDEAFDHPRRGAHLVFSATDRPQLQNLRHAKRRLMDIIDRQRADSGRPPMDPWTIPDVRYSLLTWAAGVTDVAIAYAALNKSAGRSVTRMLLNFDADCLQAECDQLFSGWGNEIEMALQDAGHGVI
jgi:hypothetical protein